MKAIEISGYLRVLTNGMVLFPFLFPAGTALIFEMSWKGVGNLFLSPAFYLASALWIASGYGIRRMQKWSWYTFNTANILTLYLLAVIFFNYTDSAQKLIALILSVFVLLHIYFTSRKEVLVPYLFPKIRWWEFGIAGMHHLGVKIWSRPAFDEPGQILDISSKGCFIKSPGNYALKEPVEVMGQAYGYDFRIKGQVVWIADSTVTHPRGIGVQFLEQDKSLRRKMKIISGKFKIEKQEATSVIES